MTVSQLVAAVSGMTTARAEIYLPLLNAEFEKRNFTVRQKAHFLSQVGHESLGFKFTREIWGPTATQRRYEGRRDLGNTEQGDGKKFMGRGLIQVTGRANYKACSLALYGDEVLLRSPEILETPKAAVDSAFWYWDKNGLAKIDHIERLTKRINGGYNGFADRKARFEKALKVLS